MTVNEIEQEIIKKKVIISAMREEGVDELAIEIAMEELRQLRRRMSLLKKGNIVGKQNRKSNIGDIDFNRKVIENYTGNEFVDMITADDEDQRDDEVAAQKSLEDITTKKEAMYAIAYKELGTLKKVAERYGVNVSSVWRAMRSAEKKVEAKRKLEKLQDIVDGETLDMKEGLHRKYVAEMLTGNQMLHFYLYYGEKISVRDIAEARKAHSSTVSRQLQAANNKLDKYGDISIRNVKALGEYVLKKYGGIEVGKEYRAYRTGHGATLKRNIRVDGVRGRRCEACRIPSWMKNAGMDKMLDAFEEFKNKEGRGQ